MEKVLGKGREYLFSFNPKAKEKGSIVLQAKKLVYGSRLEPVPFSGREHGQLAVRWLLPQMCEF